VAETKADQTGAGRTPATSEIKAAHKRNRETYGAERLQDDLADNGVSMGVHRIKRIKKEHGIR
jgi:putative transposase